MDRRTASKNTEPGLAPTTIMIYYVAIHGHYQLFTQSCGTTQIFTNWEIYDA